jgi:hypothetical protein
MSRIPVAARVAVMLRSLPKTFSLALAAAALLPAAASASSVTYVDGGNVRVASPDGAINRAVSTDGSTANPYHLPTAADDGEITAIQGGNTSSKILAVFAPNGGKTVNVLPWQIGGFTNIGPNGASVNPTGGQIAYTYLKNYGPYSGYPNGGFQSRMAIVTRRQPGSPTSPMVDQAQGWEEPTWIDDKLVIAKGGALHLEMEPLKFTQFLQFNPDAQGRQLQITRGMVSRDKSRYLLQVRDWNNVEGLYLATHTGAFPGGTVTQACWIPVNGDLDDHWGLSPDGTQVTWADKGGVQVGTYSPERQAASLCQGARTTLSPTGSEPSFGAATLTVPTPPPADPPPPPPAPPAPPATPVVPKTPAPTTPTPSTTTVTPRTTAPGGVTAAETTGAPALELAAPAAVKSAASLGGGLKVAATAPKPGTLSAKLADKGRTLGTAKLTVTKAGRYTLKLKLTKAGKKAVKRLKGKKVTLTVTFAPKGGGARLSSTAKVALR